MPIRPFARDIASTRLPPAHRAPLANRAAHGAIRRPALTSDRRKSRRRPRSPRPEAVQQWDGSRRKGPESGPFSGHKMVNALALKPIVCICCASADRPMDLATALVHRPYGQEQGCCYVGKNGFGETLRLHLRRRDHRRRRRPCRGKSAGPARDRQAGARPSSAPRPPAPARLAAGASSGAPSAGVACAAPAQTVTTRTIIPPMFAPPPPPPSRWRRAAAAAAWSSSAARRRRLRLRRRLLLGRLLRRQLDRRRHHRDVDEQQQQRAAAGPESESKPESEPKSESEPESEREPEPESERSSGSSSHGSSSHGSSSHGSSSHGSSSHGSSSHGSSSHGSSSHGSSSHGSSSSSSNGTSTSSTSTSSGATGGSTLDLDQLGRDRRLEQLRLLGQHQRLQLVLVEQQLVELEQQLVLVERRLVELDRRHAGSGAADDPAVRRRAPRPWSPASGSARRDRLSWQHRATKKAPSGSSGRGLSLVRAAAAQASCRIFSISGDRHVDQILGHLADEPPLDLLVIMFAQLAERPAAARPRPAPRIRWRAPAPSASRRSRRRSGPPPAGGNRPPPSIRRAPSDRSSSTGRRCRSPARDGRDWRGPPSPRSRGWGIRRRPRCGRTGDLAAVGDQDEAVMGNLHRALHAGFAPIERDSRADGCRAAPRAPP